jgi:hypothetical protein
MYVALIRAATESEGINHDWYAYSWYCYSIVEIKVVALRLAIVLACGNDNVNKNNLNEYFMQNNMFSSLIMVGDLSTHSVL